MERFIRLNRSILDCDLEKGGWRLDEEAIAAIEDEVAERAEIRFFWMLRRHRLTVIFLAKLETHFPIAVHCLHTPLL